tara:strand:- start:115 stop:1275 length:1161 start_codon:yes stop_codon:yes gene_type:complete
MKKLISILGSTGSIGTTSLKIIDKKKNNFKPFLFSANKNYKLISYQIKKYQPNFFLIKDINIYQKIKKKFKKNKIKIINSLEKSYIKKKSDITISAIPGIAGLEPTLHMIKLSKKVLLANKESIICGWNLIKKSSNKNNTKIIPIDSEHFSIYKLLENHKINEIEKIIITASGGPFLNYKQSELKKVKPKDAIKHPKWKMGKKISVDSSTMMNKILEIIEAQKLFDIPNEKLEIIIHPNSLVHAIVMFKNGLSKFLYHETSMIIPLANAIFEKDLNINDFFKKKDNSLIKTLSFEKIDENVFPIIKLKKRLNEFPSTSIIVNAANEILVDQFLKKNIPFLSIFRTITNILNDKNYKKYAIKSPLNIKQIYKIDGWARKTTIKKIKN